MTGQTIGHYKILEQLGEGGMGIVYKALDTHLDRFVAIKVLPPEKVADAERKRRFVQEAKAASALNHPNIITIYDIASENGMDFIAMEYVPGKALNQLISRKGLPLGEALKYAVQIADALAAAHAAGIIHRDLKPGNVMVSGAPERAGFVKVLDFGLAKLSDRVESAEREFTETMRQEDAPATGEGTIVGTVSYISPEQAEGKKVDARSDIFSFGALLYEMVTGRRAFQGDSKLSTLSAILREEPKPASQVVEGLPHELERIIARCLRKSPERRFQTMADLKVALEELKEESDSGTLGATGPRPPKRRVTFLWASVAAALLIAAAAGLWFGQSKTGMREAPLMAVALTSFPGHQMQPAFSPDGNEVAFAWDGEKRDNLDIYRKLIGPGPPLRLTQHPGSDFGPTWSPDGRFIAFLRELPGGRAVVLMILALGGPERKLGEASPCVPAWSPDGKWLVIADRSSPTEPESLFLLSIDSGEKRRLTTPPAGSTGDSLPAFSPDGRTLAFIRDAFRMPQHPYMFSDVYTLSVSRDLAPIGEPRGLTFDHRGNSRPAWLPGGREIVYSDSSPDFNPNLWRIAADGTGKPQRLASLGAGAEDPAISRQGHRLAYIHPLADNNIARIEMPGPSGNTSGSAQKTTAFISSPRLDGGPQFSPDGKRIAFASGRLSRPDAYEIWVAESDGSNAVQLTSLDAESGTARWSPDGNFISFDSNAPGHWEIYLVSASGGKPRRLTSGAINNDGGNWSLDGKWIYFTSDRTGREQVWKMPVLGGEAIQVTRNGGTTGYESRDGKFLYYAKDRFGTSLWKIPLGGRGRNPGPRITLEFGELRGCGNRDLFHSGIAFPH